MLMIIFGALVTGGLLYIPNLYSLLVFRVIQGYWVGSFTAMGSLIIKEISPTELSGSLGTLVQLTLGMGMTTVYFLNYCLKKIYNDVTC
jgi:MFS family permease